jgi:HK97 gp10 family phage protein
MSAASNNKSFQIIGLDEVNRLFEGLPQAMNTIFPNIGQKHAQIVYDKAYKIVPVKTGRLRSSIGFSITPHEIRIFATAQYAAAVHFGTYRMPARPFLYGPFDEQIDIWINEIMMELDNYLRNG